ncbi:MAG: cytochrome c-type biogenesis protein CcmH, partial [Burkholderiaceae bacterium]|nr:cytochrome c-type biogenesis protein CcmH [Burkholderiaceae bacterium]
MFKTLLLLLALLSLSPAQAKEAQPVAQNPAIEARMMVLAAELRCLVCQNQTIADSHSGLAEDLRQQIREMLERGMTDEQVRSFMSERYGDFVLYKPPFKSSTALLWAGPPLLLLLALLGLYAVLRQRQRMSPDAFELDDDN